MSLINIFTKKDKERDIWYFIAVHRPLYNLIVAVSAMKNFPEFLGYKAVSYPGQLPPRPIDYKPRRMDLPPGFENDWQKIKTRRKTIIIVEEANVPVTLFQKLKWRRENCATNTVPNVEV